MTKTAGSNPPLLREHNSQFLRGLSDQVKSEVIEQLFRVVMEQQRLLDAHIKLNELKKRVMPYKISGTNAELDIKSLYARHFLLGDGSAYLLGPDLETLASDSNDHSINDLRKEILGPQGASNYIPKSVLHTFATASDETSHLVRVSETSPDPSDNERLALLRQAAKEGATKVDPSREFEAAITNQAIELLGGVRVLGRTIRREEELVAALVAGFPGEALIALQKAGYPHKVLEQVVAPKRTLMRRRADGERLTRSESDAVWRLAYALAMASVVLNGRKVALSWLMRPKSAFSDATPIDLLETSVGAEQVKRLLRQLEWGDVA